MVQWNPDFSNLLGKRKLVPKIEGGMKSRLIYELLFHDNQESKEKYHGTLEQFFSFHLNGHSLEFYSRLESCNHLVHIISMSDQGIQMKGTEQYFSWYYFLCYRG